MNASLKRLFESDQVDHAIPQVAGTPLYAELRERDRQRRGEVRAILDRETDFEAEDLYRAAWILNHGDAIEEVELAFRLAKKSFELGYAPGRWLYAAAFDRWLMYSGLPQKFGTQIVPDGQRYRLWDYDCNTTDEERAEFNVPPIFELGQRALRDSREMTQPPMAEAPQWLRRAIERWEREETTGPSDRPRSTLGGEIES